MCDDDELAALARRLEADRWRAMLEGDSERLDDLLASNLQYAHSNGNVDDKSSYMAKFRDGTFVYRSAVYQTNHLISLGAGAFAVTGLMEMEVIVSGVLRQIRSISLVVWKQEQGQWRLAAHQNTLTGHPG